ncbi:hypothetical protein CDL15_Pgr006691 [Punica granatum]|uniref:Uncharacterized protein n=1 Tax=Punica granatum TaxID=22663 RepID=A0A218X825_PUNGR|nr:hypothetical protein CDL15_Pgr006691 [Punica granatum]PKI45902.1 hypothetical protein CRG98_033701 [Punica granatum]
MAKNGCLCLWSVLSVVLILVSLQSCLVNGRALRQLETTRPSSTIGDDIRGCGQEDGDASGSSSIIGMASFVVSSNNETSRFSVFRSLAFKLASGPSRRGPGH